MSTYIIIRRGVGHSEVLHGSENVMSRTGNMRHLVGQLLERKLCTETVGRMKSGAQCWSSTLVL